MKKICLVAAALYLSSATVVTAEPALSTNPAGYSYEILNLRTDSDVCCVSGPGQRKSMYWVEFYRGAFTVLKDADVVAVQQYLVPLAANDVNGRNLYDVNSRRAMNPTYTAVHTKISEKVTLQRTELLQNPYLIQAMRVQADVVIAKKREEKTFDVKAMEDPALMAEGLFIRIKNINMSDRRELTVSVQYKRKESGTRAPFLEAVYALDTAGNEIGGDRWVTGDAFGLQGELMFRFSLKGDQIHKSLRIVAVTENEIETVGFDIKDVFQK